MRIPEHPAKLIALNLAILAVVALPLFLVLLWLSGDGIRIPTRELLAAFLYYYLSFIPLLLIGGGIHQALLFLLPVNWPSGLRRLATVVLSPVVLVALGLWGPPWRIMTEFGVRIGFSLLIYALLVRLPSPQKPGSGST